MNPDPAIEHEKQQRAQLKRMRRIATGLLVVMAVVFLVTRRLEASWPWLALLRAFAEAAMVGALADWFAVTALFKHPLGLPIPHTAIIRRNKDRIGSSIARFLEHNFMTRKVIGAELRTIDFSASLASWLADAGNSRYLARRMASIIPALLRMADDEDVGRFLQQRAAATLPELRLAPLLGELLAILKSGGQHHHVFDHVIELAAAALERNRPYIRQKIHESSPRWLPKSIDERFFERLLEELHNILEEMQEEGSEWRQRFESAVESFIDKLKTSPEYEARIAGALRQTFAHEDFRGYVTQVWQDIRVRLERDARAGDSHTVARLEQALQALARALEQDRAVRVKLNRWLRGVATEAIVDRHRQIAQLVERVIRGWDADTVAHKIELYVGKDLQYIRINGTLVGGMVGLLLHLFARALA